jgi:hypothetical protein
MSVFDNSKQLKGYETHFTGSINFICRFVFKLY